MQHLVELVTFLKPTFRKCDKQATQLAALLQANRANLRAIAAQLNRSGYTTWREEAFHPLGVQRLPAKVK